MRGGELGGSAGGGVGTQLDLMALWGREVNTSRKRRQGEL